MRFTVPLVVGLLAATQPVCGLLIQAVDVQGQAVLLIHDCRDDDAKRLGRGCAENEQHFSQGDAEMVKRALQKRSYKEVWLFSNGGSLDEGIGIANLFHQFQVTVRVPAGADCISSCTVAFMGGLFRFVDKGATYQVHSASDFLNGVPDDMSKRLRADTEGELERFAADEQKDARELAKELFQVFQQGLLHPGMDPANSARLNRWLKVEAPALTYIDSPALSADVKGIRSEGDAAAQQILERIERDSMNSAIGELRAIVSELGPRANPALNMLSAMYSSRISDTNNVSPETLLGMGYVTKIFDTGTQ